MAETYSDREVGQDKKLHLRWKYMCTGKYINETGCLNKILFNMSTKWITTDSHNSEVLSQHLRGRTDENHKKLQSG
jgi:hypothetical protein